MQKKNVLSGNIVLAFTFAVALILVFGFVAPVFCGIKTAKADVKSITVFSWEDYIDEGYDLYQDELSDIMLDRYTEEELETSILDIFTEKTGIEVNYHSFATNEEMYNELKKNPDACDLICPSEYMILKMKSEGLIKPYSVPENYADYGSPFIKEVFEDLGLNEGEKTYAVGYMWGTMGLIYNKDVGYTAEDFIHWSNLYEDRFSGKFTVKDSLRDTYIMMLAVVYEEELMSLKSEFENGTVSDYNNDGVCDENDYKYRLTTIFNRTDYDTVDKVGDALIELKSHLYAFEVDAGKNDLISGKIDVNFAWSGDAVFAMSEAENVGVNLGYAVPEEGSNVWFDGWVMTKNADEELASEFLNFISDPTIAVRNMEYVGYTSCIGGDDVFEYVFKNYSEDEGTAQDLKYFFDPADTTGKYLVTVSEDEADRYLFAQYADEETIRRCAVMDNFSDEDLELVNEMWNKVKLITLPTYALILIAAAIVLLIAGFVIFKFRDKIFERTISSEQNKPRKKGYKVVKIEDIK